tara:strand:- start:2784 stop:4067 length:1284 start_codon:yes stop_codon:yes gene_type:complete
MQAVIICGGKGSRLKSLIGNKPKALVKFNNKENLKIQIETLKRNGIKSFLFLVNNFEFEIREFLKKNYEDRFIIIKDEDYFGTGGCLYGAKKYLQKKFVIVYSDLFLKFNFKNFVKESLLSKCCFSCVVHANNHPFDSDTVDLDKNYKIKKIYKKNTNNFKINNAISGVYFAKKNFLNYFYFKKKKNYDLVNDVLPFIIKKNHNVYGYKTIEYIKDFGTPGRIKDINNDIKKNKIKNLDFSFKSKAIFLDRDGVINQENKKVKNIKNFKIFPNTNKVIKKINNNKIPCFIISNQSGLAKKEFSLIDLFKVISKLDNYLSQKKAYIDDFLICPHYDKLKYKNTNISFFSKYRKPNPGMITYLATKYRINLKRSFFIGDTDIDVLTGKKAGLKTILVEGPKLKDYKMNIKPTFKVKSLKSAVNLILRKN